MNVVIIGSGNVATHLSIALNEVGHNIVQVYSRKLEHAKHLAVKVDSQAIDDLSNVIENADLYMIAVGDAVIDKIVSALTFTPKLIVHTAGSIPLSVLEQFPSYGVFYPLQSFSKDRSLDISKVPFCIEASNQDSEDVLMNLAKELSNNVRLLNSEQRKQCHLAAVFANNFVNHFYTLSADILQDKNIEMDILHPLIEETANKIKDLHPAKAQTGPAVRNDINVMDDHKRLLSAYGLADLYSFVSTSILKYNK